MVKRKVKRRTAPKAAAAAKASEKAHLLKIIANHSNKSNLRKGLLKNIPDHMVKDIVEFMHNVTQGNVPLRGKQKQVFKKYKRAIRLLGKGPYKPLYKKRTLLVKQSGGFIGSLLPIIASVLLSHV